MDNSPPLAHALLVLIFSIHFIYFFVDRMVVGELR
jgi:hypothetical protein